MSRYVVQFSCGAASAVAAKLTLAKHPDVVLVNAYIAEEHPDNRRFLADCEKWLGQSVIVLRDERYGASTLEVWRRRRYIKGQFGAPCATVLKRELLDAWRRPDDIIVLGYTVEEINRLDAFIDANAGQGFWCPLIEQSLTKADCLAILDREGLTLPMMYRMGYENANCIGCPKGGQTYWQAIREDFPERFAEIVSLQQQLGPGAHFLRFRSGPRAGERMSLHELPAGRGPHALNDDWSCSFFCELTLQDIA